jgi:hypothetical protein
MPLSSMHNPAHQLVTSLPAWGGIIIATLAVCTLLSASWEQRLQDEQPRVVLRGAGPRSSPPGQISRGRQTPGSHVFQKIRESGGIISAEYGFVNYNDDPLTVFYSIPSRELSAYKLDYGYTTAERNAFDLWQKHANDEAYQHAVRTRQSQEQLNRAGEKISQEHRSKLATFFHARGFSLKDNTLIVDIPEVVRRNVKKLRGVALEINRSGEKLGYDSDSIISAAIALVQTAVRYENVPMESAGRQTGGFYPPLETMATGRGDCDTKTALLGAILLNWDRIKAIGVGVPNHYLMGVLRSPAKGDVYVEYKGLRYVLVEPAGPGWLPPGTVSRDTVALLNARKSLKIEPF